jgi:hypothetical protein
MEPVKSDVKQKRCLVSGIFQITCLTILIFLFPAYTFSYTHLSLSGENPHLQSQIEDAKDHDRNQVLLSINNMGPIGLDIQTGNGRGFWPKNTFNNYIFGCGLWFGAKADVDNDGDLDKVFVQGYNPLAGDSEFDPGRAGQDPEDPLARIFDSTNPVDLTEWPDEFRDVSSGDPIVNSLQDFVTIYNDTSNRPVFGISNLGIEVKQRSMAFSHDLSQNIIYVEWDLTNVSESMEHGPYVFEDAWIGFDMDTDVGVSFGDDLSSLFRDMVTPGGDTLVVDAAIAWDSNFSENNFTGTPGFLGLALIRGPGNDIDGIDNDEDGLIDESPFNGIDDDNDGSTDEPDEVDELGLINFCRHCGPSVPCEVNDPEFDSAGYDILSCISEENPDSSSNHHCLESTTPADVRFMISSGPFDWLPGQTIRILFAFVFASPVGSIDQLEFVGDPPRPDPNDPILADFITSVLEARRFARSEYTDFGTFPTVDNATNFFPVNMAFYGYPTAVSIFDTVGIARASLFYSIDNEPFESIELINTDNNLWSVELPGPDFGSRVELYYEVVDSLYQLARDPEDAPRTTFGYDVVHLPAFTDVTTEAGLSTSSYYNSSGMAVADYDGDGDQDIYRVMSQKNNLYRNEGDGTFIIVTDVAGLGDISTSCAAWADYDNDGHLDLFVTDIDAEGNHLYRSKGDGTFSDMTDSASVRTPDNVESFSWGDYNNDGYVDLYLTRRSWNESERNVLYRNCGDGSFTDVAGDVGLDFSWGGSYYANRVVIWVDVDNDGWQDLFLTNPTTESSHLYRNNRNGTFLDIAGSSDISEVYSGQVMFADYDNDGDFDLITEGNNGDIYENQGDGRFDSVGESLEIEGGIFIDVDNSGFYDIIHRVNYWHSVFYLNDGSDFFMIDGLYDHGLFVEYREPLSFDFDNDGDLDILTLHYRDILFRNEGFVPEYTNNWLHVNCEGTVSNSAALGAKIRVTTGDLTQTHVVGGARGIVQESLLAEFGLGDAMLVDRLVVEWPSGKVQEETALAVNQVVTIIEDSTLVGIEDSKVGSSTLPKVFSLSQNYPNPFNPSTTIKYDIPAGSGPIPAKIYVYDIRGRLIKKLVDKEMEPGRYQVHWNGRNDRGQRVVSGIYLYRIEAGEFVSTRKMMLLK